MHWALSERDTREKIHQLISELYNGRERTRRFVPGQDLVHYSGDLTSEREINAAIASLLDGRLAAGKHVEAFERAFAAYAEARNVITVHSGSAADLLSFAALRNEHRPRPLLAGDEVITSALSFATAVGSIVLNGLKPVFVDAELPTYVMNVERVKEAIGPRTRAIMAVHIFGNSCDLDALTELAREHDLVLVEDCCDAAGTLYNGRKVGSIGDLGTFSFYPAHQMTTMEGGAITTADDLLAYILKSLRMWGRAIPCPHCGTNFAADCELHHNLGLEGMTNYDPNYLFINIGHNSKMTEVQAAFGLAQLERLDEFNRIRRENFNVIVQDLKPYGDSLILPEATPKSDPAWYSIPLTVRPDAPFTRDELAAYLHQSKIEYRFLFTGNILKQPAFKKVDCRVQGSLDVADLATTNSLFIGCHQGMTREMRDYVSEKLTSFLDKHT